VSQSALAAVIAAGWDRASQLPNGARRLVGAASLRARVYTAATSDLSDWTDFEAEALRRDAGSGLDADLRSMCHSALAEAYLAGSRDKAAHAESRLALAFADEAEDDACRFRAAGLQACALALNGEFRRAAMTSERCRGLERSHGWTQNTASLPLILADMLIAYAHLDPAALESVHEALCDSAAQGPIWLAYQRLATGWAHLLQRDYDLALVAATRLTGGSDLEILPGLVTGFALKVQALALVQRGEPNRALNVLEGLRSEGDHVLCFGLHRATARLQLGENREALVATDGCARLGARHNLRTLPAVLLRRAVANLRLGHVDAADRAFAEAFHLMSSSGALGPLVGLGQDDLSVLYARLLQQSPELVRAVMRFRRLAEACPPAPPPHRALCLTPRESIVADWLRTSMGLRDIAAGLFVSGNTLKTQLRTLYAKLRVSSRADAVALLEGSGFYERRRPVSGVGDATAAR